MAPKIIETSAGGPYRKHRVLVDLNKEVLDRFDWKAGDDLEAIPKKDGLLLRKKDPEQ